MEENLREKIKGIGEGTLDGRDCLKPIYIEAHDLNDLWFQAVDKVLEYGYFYPITKGSYEGEHRLGFDYFVGRVKNPGNRPIIPTMPEGSGLPPPTDMEYVENQYLPYLMTDQKTKTEDYTYGERLNNPKARLEVVLNATDIKEKTGVDILSLNNEKLMILYPYTVDIKKEGNEVRLLRELPFNVNPVQQVIKDYKEKGYGTNQETMEIGMPADIILNDPPCARLIDTRIRYGRLHFFPYFRSWDLWGGLPGNLAGMQLMKEYMASEIGVNDGEMIVASKGLHIYKYVWELAELRANKQLPIDYKEKK